MPIKNLLPPKRENRKTPVLRKSLVLRSAAEENGVSMLREGGHHTRDARAFLSVCGHHSDITKIDHKKNTPHTQRKERPSFT